MDMRLSVPLNDLSGTSGTQSNDASLLLSLSPQATVGSHGRLFISFLEKFDVANHVFGSQHIVDQHEAP